MSLPQKGGKFSRFKGILTLEINTVVLTKTIAIFWMFLPGLFLHAQTTTVLKSQESINHSIDSLQQLLSRAKEDTSKVNGLFELGLQLNKANRSKELLNYGTEGMGLARKLNYKRGLGLSGLLTGLYYYRQSNYTLAFKEILAASEILEQVGDIKNLGLCSGVLSTILFYQSRHPEAIKHLNKTLKIIEDTKNLALEPDVLNNLGKHYGALGDISRGLECFYKALQISEKLNDKQNMAVSYQGIGVVFLDQFDDSIALNNFFLASNLNLETGNRFAYAQNCNTIGDIFLRQGKYATSLGKFREALKIYEEPGAPGWGTPWSLSLIGSSLEYTGDSAIKEGNPTTAKTYYREAYQNYSMALEKYKEQGILPVGLADQYLSIGGIDIKLGRINEAKKNLQTALRIFKEKGTTEMIGKTYLALSKIDSLEGNYKNAYRYLQLYTLYRDSASNADDYKRISQHKSQYEVGKKEEEIKRLAAENELKTTIAAKQKQQKLFAYATIGLVVLLGSYSFHRYRKWKKAEVDQGKLKDRLHISQGLHDNIGSTLSSISVYTQVAQKLSEKARKEDLNEMLGKIQATSSEMISEMNDIVWAIHPRNDNMEKIILRMESYAKPMLATKNINFRFEYEPTIITMDLDMEKRKNCYLLFKEAVNNAFKYSGCTEIVTRISNTKGRIEIVIKDNGVGFDVQQELTGVKLTLSGNGLRNMKMRAEEMKGDLQINSVAGEGTEIRLSIPLP